MQAYDFEQISQGRSDQMLAGASTLLQNLWVDIKSANTMTASQADVFVCLDAVMLISGGQVVMQT